MKALRWVSVFSLALLFLVGIIPSLHAKNLGIVWYTSSGMVDAVMQGFDDKIKTLAPDMDIEYQKAVESEEEFGRIVDRFNREKDAMIVLRSHGAKWLAEHPPSIPAFIGACTNPQELGVVKNLDAPEGNITGVTYFIPTMTQIKVFKAMIPDMNSLILMVEEGHPSSALDTKGTRAACESIGIAYHEAVCKSSDDIDTAVAMYKDTVSVMVIGNQALIMDNTKRILEKAGKTPVVAFSSKPVKEGALGGFVADNIRLGNMLAQSVADVLVNGKPISAVPVKTDAEPQFYINGKTVVDLGITIPSDILMSAEIISQ